MGRKQPQLTIANIAGIQEILCSGRVHRLALLNDGQIAMLDHPRKLMRLEDEMRRREHEHSCACVEHVNALKKAFGTGWSGSPRTEYASTWRESMMSQQYSALFVNREGEMAAKRMERRKVKYVPSDPIVKPFKHRVAGLADVTFRRVLADMKCHSRETNIRAFSLSDPDCQTTMKHSPGWRETHVAGVCKSNSNWVLYFDVLRWYTKVYLKGYALRYSGVIVLKVVQTDTYGTPTVIAALKPTPKGQAAQVGIARVTSTGRVLFQGEA